MASITIIGAGSWGTALGIHLARLQHTVWLWGRDLQQMATMAATRRNARYLPEAVFPAALRVSEDLAASIAQSAIIIIAVPSHAFRDTLSALAPAIVARPEVRLLWITKGLDPATHQLLHEVAAQYLSADFPLAVLSGPTFAREVAAGLPAAITLACTHEPVAQQLQQVFHSRNFRVYTSGDMAGVALGGATKNVLAIAVGIAEGLRCGANAQAALITRGMAEMLRLGKTLGASTETLMGLAGLGDLILTCTNNQSRNRRFGVALGQGDTLQHAQTHIGQVVEGITTAHEIFHLAQQHQVEMPIVAQVHAVLYQQRQPAMAVEALLAREPKSEDST